jgi:hypothetical protein
MPEINVKGKDQFDELSRTKALEKLNTLGTKELTRLAGLCDSKKAVEYFTSDIKFNVLKSFIK